MYKNIYRGRHILSYKCRECGELIEYIFEEGRIKSEIKCKKCGWCLVLPTIKDLL